MKLPQINKTKALIFFIFLILLVVGGALYVLISDFYKPMCPFLDFPGDFGLTPLRSYTDQIRPFLDEQDFVNYLAKSKEAEDFYLRGIPLSTESEVLPLWTASQPFLEKKEVSTPSRVSPTNVQVPGIDEPDVLKTDGINIYFMPGQSLPVRYEPFLLPETSKKIIYPLPSPKIKVIKAYPPKDLNLISEIEEGGDLLLASDNLIIFGKDKLVGYDISNPEAPKKKWTIELEEGVSIEDGRLFEGKVYLVAKKSVNWQKPCPIEPLKLQGEKIVIDCAEIYHPIYPVPVNITFFVMKINPASGIIEEKISFVGTQDSVVYMSKNALYITYLYHENGFKILSEFFKSECKECIPDWIREKMQKLENYEISDQAKLFELENDLENYLSSLDPDRRLQLENEIRNRRERFLKDHQKEIEKTGIVKIWPVDLSILAEGKVPGRLLNQFSLDEYQNNLRIATTISPVFVTLGYWTRAESTNDLYILDSNLKIIGKIENLGIGERIYSVRFIEDKGYLVTFRQTDPFFVLDLSDPKNPQLKGELKIPGYSSYLHPINKNLILGIGKEDWQVKISLFDVFDPQNPKEIDKYILNESFSDILSTHHAFLLDEKYQVFFVPAAQGGYVFSYKDNKITLKKAISQISCRRALYLANYLYFISDSQIVVLDEENWERVGELKFQ